MDKEYEEGRQSYLTSHGENLNPYEINSPAYNRFEAGWKQAAALYPGILRERQRQRDLEQHRANDQKDEDARRTKEEARRSAEAYRKAKGR